MESRVKRDKDSAYRALWRVFPTGSGELRRSRMGMGVAVARVVR
jgi:hypothetical protein